MIPALSLSTLLAMVAGACGVLLLVDACWRHREELKVDASPVYRRKGRLAEAKDSDLRRLYTAIWLEAPEEGMSVDEMLRVGYTAMALGVIYKPKLLPKRITRDMKEILGRSLPCSRGATSMVLVECPVKGKRAFSGGLSLRCCLQTGGLRQVTVLRSDLPAWLLWGLVCVAGSVAGVVAVMEITGGMCR